MENMPIQPENLGNSSNKRVIRGVLLLASATAIAAMLAIYPVLDKDNTKNILKESPNCFSLAARTEYTMEAGDHPTTLRLGLQSSLGYWLTRLDAEDLADQICEDSESPIGIKFGEYMNSQPQFGIFPENLTLGNERITTGAGFIKFNMPEGYNPATIETNDQGFGVIRSNKTTYFVIPGSETALGQSYLMDTLGFGLNSFGTESDPKPVIPGFTVRPVNNISFIETTTYPDKDTFQMEHPDLNEYTVLPLFALRSSSGNLPYSVIMPVDGERYEGGQVRSGSIDPNSAFIIVDEESFRLENGEYVIQNREELSLAVHGTFAFLNGDQRIINSDTDDWQQVVNYSETAAHNDSGSIFNDIQLLVRFEGSSDIYHIELPPLSALDPEFLDSAINSIEAEYGQITHTIFPDMKYTASLGTTIAQHETDVVSQAPTHVTSLNLPVYGVVVELGN